jgi:hypothetical protein
MSAWTTKLVWSELVSAAAAAEPVEVERDASQIPVTERLDQVRQWLSLLAPEDRGLVWARARNTRWKQICWAYQISRPTAHRRRQRALNAIVAHLRMHTA